jgi:hypothetical protein
MIRWTLRELLLLLTVVGFALFHFGNTLRLRVVSFIPFGVTTDELTDWAREIDPSIERPTWGYLSGPFAGGKERWNHMEFNVATADVPKITEHWRTRVAEKIKRENWQSSGQGSGTGMFSFSLGNGDSRYDVAFYWSTASPTSSGENSDDSRVRLTVRWIEVGYTRLYVDKHLINDPAAADTPK